MSQESQHFQGVSTTLAYVESEPTHPAIPTRTIEQVWQETSPQLLFILLLGGGLILLQAVQADSVQSNSTKKNRKGRATWAGKTEIRVARTVALRQLHQRSRKSACTWIVRPTHIEYPNAACYPEAVWQQVLQAKSTAVSCRIANLPLCVATVFSNPRDRLRYQPLKKPYWKRWKPAPKVGSIPREMPILLEGERQSFKVTKANAAIYGVAAGTRLKTETIWIPDTQRSVMVVGAPGSGKTFSAIDPMMRGVVEQGYPLVLYDFKYPTQTSAIAWYAQQLGYRIHVFAPGFPESDVLNVLDFLTGEPEQDAALARQLASTLNKNFRLGQPSSGDTFFKDAGDQLIQAVLMQARVMEYPDLITVQALLELPDLSKRLMHARTINPWIKKAFAQFLSVAESEKTAASIIGTATLNFTRLMMARILACVVGKTTLPLDLEGKILVVFGMDREIRDVVAPIVATAITMIVNRNLFRKGGRKDPLFCVFDELPTLYLDCLVNWENESRSDGFNGIIGYQNKSQLERIYGKELAMAIMGGCATKFIFNPGEVESAEYFSKLFGDEEIARTTISKGKSAGKGGTTINRSVEVSTRKLVSPEELTGLPPGTCYMTNPQYANPEMAYLPRRLSVVLPPWELDLARTTEQNWSIVQQRLLKRTLHHQRIPTDHDVRVREQNVQRAFPIPSTTTTPSAVDVLANLF